MALTDKLSAIGDAIRAKTGKSEKLTLDQMPTEIASIEGGGGTTPANPIIEPLSVTENGTYTAPAGVDGYSPIEVNVPIPNGYILPSGTKTITENGTHDAREYESVAVNVPIPDGYIKPSGTLNITKNGTYDVAEKASAVVSIPEREIVLQNKTIDENGTYTADEGYDGLGTVTVSVAGGTNTESEEVAALLSNTMTVLDNSLVTTLRTRVCQAATKLITVNLPNVTSLGAYAFYQCSNLETVTLPKLTTISTQTWYMCPKLEHVDCGQLGSITAQTFASCTALKALILRKTSSICTLSNANGVSGSGIGKGTGYVYVPSALIETYKTATNWSTFASQFRAIEDYPDITGG
jgi:hypothetical protein